jgi:hypothetical protein
MRLTIGKGGARASSKHALAQRTRSAHASQITLASSALLSLMPSFFAAAMIS